MAEPEELPPPIDRIIAELGGISHALWRGDADPRLHRRGGGRLSDIEVGGSPAASEVADELIGPDDGARKPRPDRLPDTPFIDLGGEAIDSARWTDISEETKRGVRKGRGDKSGVDALAWYRSFHADQTGWGIYIPFSSLVILSEGDLLPLKAEPGRRLALAWEILLLHERFHFAVDVACAWFELLLRAPVCAEYHSRMTKGVRFLEHVERQDYLEIEEAAANAFMLRALGDRYGKRARTAARRFVGEQPAGYRDGLQLVTDALFRDAAKETMAARLGPWALEHRLNVSNPALDIFGIVPIRNLAVLAQCPVRVVNDLEDKGLASDALSFIQRIEAIEETPKFTKRLRGLSARLQSDWLAVKAKLFEGRFEAVHFEKFKDVFSVRLSGGVRAHLHPQGNGLPWLALDIGSHKAMGHG
jgi:hypothetical protein